MKNASSRLYHYLLSKLDEEPVSTRADLCEDLASFLPNDAIAERLREQARALRRVDQESQVIRLSLKHGAQEESGPLAV